MNYGIQNSLNHLCKKGKMIAIEILIHLPSLKGHFKETVRGKAS